MPKHAFEALMKVLHSLFDDETKPPLHVGEVMSCWTYLTVLEESVALEQLAINTTADTELNNFLHKTMGGASSQAARLKDFLQQEGIPLPPASEPKPVSDPSAIPLGAKMTDSEIANLVSVKIASAITLCAAGTAQSVRNDVGIMFFEYQTEAMQYGALLKSIMQKRGWLKIPPYYRPPGGPNS
ncbi:DUF3231 family protein [Ureibacillus aquaedulcis]|uniref:DUF3231 family protein n=1 Tax=Ureibacillus aquaedulcis TaxID=3058421 RepID=A0ABT8GTH3_9BACL|nr:DUF3231 family protein [Ureibacillus sp. BA0131]MDN4494713.1 DUF3231 family protein [Ureibacillus sp. BA0131]